MTAKAHQRQPKRIMSEPMLVSTVNVLCISVKNWKNGIRKQMSRIRLTA